MVAAPPSVQTQIDQVFNRLEHGELAQAVALSDTILAASPDSYVGYYLRAQCAQHGGNSVRAIAWLNAATQFKPDASVWINLAEMYAHSGHPQMAIDATSRAEALAPSNEQVQLLRASLLNQQGHYQAAIAHFKKAIQINGDDYRGYLGAAKVYHFIRELDQAEPFYQQALALASEQDTDLAHVQWEYAMQCLLKGDLEQGWPLYDARLTKPMHLTSIYPFNFPQWQGQDLAGKTLLVHGEQGIGDEIMYASILPELIQQAKTVVVATTPGLHALFERSFPTAKVYAMPRDAQSVRTWADQTKGPDWLNKHKQIDYQSPIGSLPRWARPNLASFGSQAPYLTINPSKAKKFKAQLKPSNGLLVGLVWQGNLATGEMGREKSIPLNMLTPLASVTSAHFVSLQLPDAETQIDSVTMLCVQKFGDQLSDFDDTAALISNLDLVITVDTSVAHLAAALGKPTWVLLRHAADWRYLDQGESCYWYSSMRLFRQRRPGEWAPVVADLVDKLKHFKSGH